MAYSQYGKVEAVDFNSIVGTTTTSTTGELNAIWGVGNGDKGYGQSAIPQVAQNGVIEHSDWANVTNTTSSISRHQGTAITAVSTPDSGIKVTYNSNIVTNISTVTGSRKNAAAQGTSATTSISTSSTWSNQLTFTATVTFESGDKARYFFNAGGQISLGFRHPAGNAIDSLMFYLATNSGTIVMSGHTAGSVTVAGQPYNGVTKVGGSGTPDTLAATSGYYGLGTSDTLIFKQLATGTPAGYVNSYISVNAKTNGTQGSNGDNGSVITYTIVWDQVPNGLTCASGTTVDVTVRPPSILYLSNSWGTVTVAGSASGS